MKVLVTGGAGFIGSYLVRDLLSSHEIDAITIIDDLSTGYEENIAGLDLKFVRASILDENTLARAMAGVDAVVHLAALGSVPRSISDPIATHEVNARGTLNVLQAARANGDCHVILASSSSVYGANPDLPKSEDLMCQPMSPYAVTKLAAEQYAMAFSECYGLPVLPFRFFNVYGPRQRAGHAYAAVIPTFLDAVLRNEAVPINGDGRQSRDFTFVGSVSALIVAALCQRATSGPTNLAFGSRTTLMELVAEIELVMARSVRVKFLAKRPGDVLHSQGDSRRLRDLFAETVPVPLGEGLGQTVAWMESAMSRGRQTH